MTAKQILERIYELLGTKRGLSDLQHTKKYCLKNLMNILEKRLGGV